MIELITATDCYSWEGKRQVWLVPFADERVSVQVWDPSRTSCHTWAQCWGDSRRGAISRIYLYIFYWL